MNSIGKSARSFLLLVLFAISPAGRCAEDGPAEDLRTAASVAALSNSIAEIDAQLLKNFLLLQDQLRSTQRALEQGREQAAADAKRVDELMAERLNLVEQSLAAQRAQELVALQESTRTVITIASVITGTGLLIVLLAGFAQVRAMTRLTEVSRQLTLALPASTLGELPVQALLSGRESVQSANTSLLDAISRLERRLEDMETRVNENDALANGHKQIPAPAPAPAPAGSPPASPSSGNSPQLTTLLREGQALLNIDKVEEALDQFDEALRLEPRNVEAWIKKGTALERLQRTDEAIVAYDQAIAVDGSIATAYLFKAGVYNRQKKYAEALQCYEKALGAQQKSRAQSART